MKKTRTSKTPHVHRKIRNRRTQQRKIQKKSFKNPNIKPVVFSEASPSDNLQQVAAERKVGKDKSQEIAVAQQQMDSLRLLKQEQEKKKRSEILFSQGFLPEQTEENFNHGIMSLIQDIDSMRGLGSGVSVSDYAAQLNDWQNLNSSERMERLNSDGNNLSSVVNPYLGFGPGQTPITSLTPLTANNIYAPVTINWMALMYAYKTHGILQSAIDVPVLDSVRGGLDFFSNGQISSGDLTRLDMVMRANGIYKAVKDSDIWARLFGGGALIVNVIGDDYSKPLGSVAGKKLEFYDCTRWELGSEARIPKSGFYDFFGIKIHKSRVLTLVGKRAPWLLRYQLAGWGFSEIERMVESFNGWLRTNNAIYELLLEAKIDVYKMKGYRTSIGNAFGKQNADARIQQANATKSFGSALILDSEDEYLQKQVSFGGLSEILREWRMNITQSLRMPATKLWGISASGFSSGEEDNENYNAMVESEVREPLMDVFRKVVDLISESLYGRKFFIDFTFKPLRIVSAQDEEVIKTSKHNRFLSLLTANVISRSQFLELERKEKLIPLGIDDGLNTTDARGIIRNPLTPEEEAKDDMIKGFGEEGDEPEPIGFLDSTGHSDDGENNDEHASDNETEITEGTGIDKSRVTDEPKGEHDTVEQGAILRTEKPDATSQSGVWTEGSTAEENQWGGTLASTHAISERQKKEGGKLV